MDLHVTSRDGDDTGAASDGYLHIRGQLAKASSLRDKHDVWFIHDFFSDEIRNENVHVCHCVVSSTQPKNGCMTSPGEQELKARYLSPPRIRLESFAGWESLIWSATKPPMRFCELYTEVLNMRKLLILSTVLLGGKSQTKR